VSDASTRGASAHDVAEFLTRAGEDTALIMAAESVARNPSLAGEAVFREFCSVFDARLGELARRGIFSSPFSTPRSLRKFWRKKSWRFGAEGA
jgi:hypothetical protein